MSTERVAGQVTIHCDKCPEYFQSSHQTDFSSVWSEARESGWVAFKVKGEFCHYCPACAQEN